MFPSAMSPCDGQLIWRNPPDLVSSTLDNDAYLRYKYRLAMEQKRRRRPPLTKDLFVSSTTEPSLLSTRREEQRNGALKRSTVPSSREHIYYGGLGAEVKQVTNKAPRPRSLDVEKWLQDQQQYYNRLSPERSVSPIDDMGNGLSSSASGLSAFTRVGNSNNLGKKRLSWNGDITSAGLSRHFGTFPKSIESTSWKHSSHDPLFRVNSQKTDDNPRKDHYASDSRFQAIGSSLYDDVNIEEERPQGRVVGYVFTESPPVAKGSPDSAQSGTQITDPPHNITSPLNVSNPPSLISVVINQRQKVIVKAQVASPTSTNLCGSVQDDPKTANSMTDDVEGDVGNVPDETHSAHEDIQGDSGIDVDPRWKKVEPGKPSEFEQQVEPTSSVFVSSKQDDRIKASAGFKRASGTLKHLISLHEGAIARVSGKQRVTNPSVRTRHSVSGVALRENSDYSDAHALHVSNKWKRHTAIGLVEHNNEFEDTVQLEEREPTPPPIPPKPKHLLETRSKSEDSLKENSVVVETHFISVSSAKEQFENLAAQTSNGEIFNERAKGILLRNFSTESSSKEVNLRYSVDKHCQTELSVCTEASHVHLEHKLNDLVSERDVAIVKHAQEILEIRQKLEEQRKVANAYQKLEDRYRRQVHDLQETLKTCSCGAYQHISKQGVTKRDSLTARNCSWITDHRRGENGTIAKADGILNELESWLNEQQSPKYSTMVASSTDGSSVHVNIASHGGSVVSSLSDFTALTAEQQDGSPLDIIDQFDATCV